MAEMDRRSFVGALAFSGLAGDVKGDTPLATPDKTIATARHRSGTAPNPAGWAKDVTRKLAAYVVSAQAAGSPRTRSEEEASRTLLNWMGCAVGGSRDKTVDIAISALSPFCGTGQATVLGRSERLDVLHTALINGISSHIFDYDDTHLRTIIHPAGPVASAILALSEYRPVSGRDFMHALVLGVEVECRIGNAVLSRAL